MLSKFPITFDDFMMMYNKVVREEFTDFIWVTYEKLGALPSPSILKDLRAMFAVFIEHANFLLDFDQLNFDVLTRDLQSSAVRYGEGFDSKDYLKDIKKIIVELDSLVAHEGGPVEFKKAINLIEESGVIGSIDRSLKESKDVNESKTGDFVH